jgi:hypothetical protein
MGAHTFAISLPGIKDPALLLEAGSLSVNSYSLLHIYTGWNYSQLFKYLRITITISIGIQQNAQANQIPPLYLEGLTTQR